MSHDQPNTANWFTMYSYKDWKNVNQEEGTMSVKNFNPGILKFPSDEPENSTCKSLPVGKIHGAYTFCVDSCFLFTVINLCFQPHLSRFRFRWRFASKERSCALCICSCNSPRLNIYELYTVLKPAAVG